MPLFRAAARRAIALASALCVLGTSLPATAFAAPSIPAPISSTEALTTDVQARVNDLLTRAEVRDALAARGVDTAQVQARVAALTDEEARVLADRLDQLPAGASDILGILFTVFIILLITDILGLTKVFPFTRPIR
jgi:hypothetical protein